MAALRQIPVLEFRPDYTTWLSEVRATLASMNMEMDAWRKNWAYDFRRDYDAGVSAYDAAMHAHTFWWQELMAESWT